MKIIQANLLDFPDGITAIAHSANCRNKMNSGIAKQIKERYPSAYTADTLANQNKTNILGSYSITAVADPNASQREFKYSFGGGYSPRTAIVGNLYTQESYGSQGRYVNYEGFYRALEEFVAFCKTNSHKLGLPYGISCGLAGGDWNIISAMIASVESRFSTEIVICKL